MHLCSRLMHCRRHMYPKTALSALKPNAAMLALQLQVLQVVVGAARPHVSQERLKSKRGCCCCCSKQLTTSSGRCRDKQVMLATSLVQLHHKARVCNSLCHSSGMPCTAGVTAASTSRRKQGKDADGSPTAELKYPCHHLSDGACL